MRELLVFFIVLLAMCLVIPASAADHTIQFQNHCSNEVSVVITGGQEYIDPTGAKYGACQCLPDLTCNPLTICPVASCPKGACNQGTMIADGGGFTLEADTSGAKNSHTTTLPVGWQGGFWSRTGCHDSPNGYVCDIDAQTCYKDGKGQVQCGGAGITTATKTEIKLDDNGGDTYDVSGVDGWSVPTTMEVVDGTGDPSNYPPQFACTVSGTGIDLASTATIAEYNKLGNSLDADKVLLKNAQGKEITVQSACSYASTLNRNKNGDIDELDYLTNSTCCKGPYGSIGQYENHQTPYLCNPDTWPDDINTARFFKHYLPASYSFAYDDKHSTFQCKSKDEKNGIRTQYVVTFCPGNEPPRINLPGSDEHTHVPVYNPGPVVTPVATPVPTQTPLPAQTPVPTGRYHPASSGEPNF